MDLSIILVNWNSTAYLREAIRGIYEQTVAVQFEIVVIDNDSPARDVDTVKAEWPDIILIKSERNLGFAGANNLAFSRCCGGVILFLNPDTKLLGPALNVMLDHLRSLPDCGVAGCRLRNSDFTTQTSCIQTFPTILNQMLDAEVLRAVWPRSPLFGVSALYTNPAHPVKVEAVSGACLMIRREAFERVGGFREEYFMYGEDIDLCYRVAREQYNNYYIGKAEMIHYGGGSSQPASGTVMKWKSIILYMELNHGRVYAAIFRAAIAITAIARLSIIRVFARGRGAGQEFTTSDKWQAILRVLLGFSTDPRVRSVRAIREKSISA